MKTIVFAATKGGTGKTSLSFTVGLEAAKHGSVFFADMDPQKSLTDLCERRSHIEGADADNPAILDGVKRISEAAAQLSASRHARDFLVVDTPGSFMEIIKDAVKAADCLVLPVQASPLDILAQEDIARLATEMGKAERTLFVLNRIDARRSVADTLARISPLFPNTPVQIRDRVDYSRALIAGNSAAELNKECAAEISTLWATIERILNHGS